MGEFSWEGLSPIDRMALFDETMEAFRQDDRPGALDILRQQISRLSEGTEDPVLLGLAETGTKEECIEALTLLHNEAVRMEQLAD
jgi:hypothetical protein